MASRLLMIRPAWCDICQRVAGMPLGIEIAAAWVRVMPCAEIAAQLMALETPYQIADERHHSLRALFESTWRAARRWENSAC